METSEYRESAKEQERISNIVGSLPQGYRGILDVGSRDGYISGLCKRHFPSVTALDIEMPVFPGEGVLRVNGDICRLPFKDGSFDVVLCVEVLEHLRAGSLFQACSELIRTSRQYVLIGVPYKQDIRFGRTTCHSCGKKNPPFGHLNTFDLPRLKELFSSMIVEKADLVGMKREKTNWLSTTLMDIAGNPWGTYGQEEPCVFCGGKVGPSGQRSVLQKVSSKGAFLLNEFQNEFARPEANWIHVLFRK